MQRAGSETVVILGEAFSGVTRSWGSQRSLARDRLTTIGLEVFKTPSRKVLARNASFQS